MSAVWAASNQRENALLLMLAIADHANDEGIAWPGIDSLAQKTRVSRRTVQRMVRQLAESGEIIMERGTGRGHTHRYRINLDRLKGVNVTPFIPFERVTVTTLKGDTAVSRKGDTAVSPEPSTTVKEPSTTAKRARKHEQGRAVAVVGGEPSETERGIYNVLVHAGASATRQLRAIAQRLATVDGATPDAVRDAFVAERDKAKSTGAKNPVGVALSVIGAPEWRPTRKARVVWRMAGEEVQS